MTAIFVRRFFIGTLVILLAFGAVPAPVGAAEPTVDAITVTVLSPAAPPAKAARRMEASVQVIGQNLLVGRKVSDVTARLDGYANLIKEIFDRVLVGYTVERVDITPGSTAHIAVTVTPWGDVVREAILELDLAGISPEVVPLLRADAGNLEETVQSVLVGLPIDAVEWAAGITKTVVRDELAARLPEFGAALDIQPGPRTVVKLALAPQGPTVQDVTVNLKSEMLPNFLLLAARPAVLDAARVMRGLPVAFVERHRDYFAGKVTAAAASHPVARRYGLTFQPVISPAAVTDVVLTANTTKYKVTLEGYLDVGRTGEDTASLRLHAGKRLGGGHEAFMEVDFLPGTVTWQFLPGWGYQIGAATTVGLKYNLSEHRNVLWLQQQVRPDWLLRLERTPATGYNEVGLRYRIHEFLGAEYVLANDEQWLRLVGNL
ncbi:hypothetical protein [Sporolituus thermophilus]|uniref:Uncharacterized protein n=1 Tax=Sporolituus thermophilus DSM 23256 TaxID=1123285 RepID=A0A1G7HF12_9FIRM|nr:hypothetical protein [Sporolituus thermophilus]SDE99087.1 hypothetical protein SAMN05660235_00016 [Sporolituus thermophilus DSM 23256]